ncbi:MAG: rhomboid family intramembrane serine protease [Planctomycetaceae bacterium]|nr:rhomboid family intramembrane serine protease [Planctomycetaceae bacterium]
MILIPTGTDAPLYHRPIGTILLILANIGCFVLTGGGVNETNHGFELTYGNGLHPSQWLLCNFFHYGIGHLVGNLVFLWIFGLVVEGKIGTWKFLGIYLGVGVLGGMIEQTVLLGYDGMSRGSGGASLAIFGLMAMSLIWAPKNEISYEGFFIYLMMVRPFSFELSIMAVSGFYLGISLLSAWLTEFAVSSAMLHLLGALIGGAIGWVMLQKKWVDCEGWDIVSVWNGTSQTQGYFESYRDRQNPRPADAADQFVSEERRNKTRRLARKFRKLLAKGELAGVLELHRKLSLLQADDLLTRDDLHELIKQLLEDEQSAAAIPILEEFLIRFPDGSTRHRLKLIELHLKRPYRPREAKAVLAGLPLDLMSGEERRHAEKLSTRIDQMISDGVYEIA